MPLHATHAQNHPIVCIPGAGASVTTFIAFAGALGDSHPIFGLQPRGLDLVHLPHASVVETAHFNVAAVATLHSVRPIHLIGHSYGGLVAFEMALQLEQSGAPVESLTLIDSDPPDERPNHSNLPTTSELFQAFTEVFEDNYEIELALNNDLMASGDQINFLLSLHRTLLSRRCLPAHSTIDMIRGSFLHFASALTNRYIPQDIRRSATHLAYVRSKRLNEMDNYERLIVNTKQWRLFSPNLTIWSGPGDHFSILRPPHVSSLAQWWRAAHS
ncbi:thioesterase domain-containing protein [Edaphobacter dinghuensis]|uniref:thioesterase domain-containing protein n=1 Tax=Edaphobacter dinghuensis TaxID=1560005 RepID=UPI001666E300